MNLVQALKNSARVLYVKYIKIAKNIKFYIANFICVVYKH